MRRFLPPALAVVAACLALVVVLLGNGVFPSFSGPNSAGSQPAQEKTVVVLDHAGNRKEMPLVDGGDPNNPIWAEAANADIRRPVVRKGQITSTWTELDRLLGNDAEYKQCVDNTIETKWDTDIPKFKASEAGTENAAPVETRYIQVVGSTKEQFSDDKVRALVKAAGVKDADKLKIVRVKEVVNTRGFKDKNGCQEFLDREPQVRINLGVPIYDKDGKATGELREDRGVYIDCHNPNWVPKAVNPSPTPSTSATPTTTSTSPTPESPCKTGCTSSTPPPGCEKPSDCPEDKQESRGPVANNNIQTPHQGQEPGGSTQESRPPTPPDNYVEPPKNPTPTTTRTSVPPPPPEPEPSEPYDICKEKPEHPSCG